jgi:hypothetical protein
MAFDFTAALNVQTNPANLNKVNKDIQKSLNKVSLNLDAKNIAQAQGEIKKLQGSLTKAKSVAVEFGEAVSLKAVNFAAYTLASTAVLKLTGAVSNATRESLKLQEELAKIAQVTNKSNKEISAQSNLLKKISVEYNIASSKVAQLTRTLAQTGLSFQQAAKAAEVLARTSLLATFDSLQSTTEGFIATLSSFSLSVDQAGQSLEAINAVSKRFAVESSDIVEAVRRTGGAFNAAGGNINELIALFTAVRSTSRESAETIATGFRTIFGRLQRPKTIEFFKELGIQLETAEGQFVGPLQAIQNISRGLDRLNISAGSTQFAEVVEQIGGIRQLSRVVPLLTQTTKITEALGVANNGTAESAEDVAKAQGTLAFQIGELQKNFAAFIDDIVSSPTFQLLAKSIIGIANALVEVGRALTPLIPLFTVLATLKLSSGLTSLIGGKGGGGGGLKGLLGFNAGGFVPGSGNRDTVPAMLTPGEFVIRKSAAQAFGAENLQAINKYANGGTIASNFKSRNLSKRVVRGADSLKGTLADPDIQFNDKDTFNSFVDDTKFYPSIIPNGFEDEGQRISPDQFETLVGNRPENSAAQRSTKKNAPLDFVGGKLIEAKRTKQKVSDNEIRDKTVRALIGGDIKGAKDIKLDGNPNNVTIPTVELAGDSQQVMTSIDAKNLGLRPIPSVTPEDGSVTETKPQRRNAGGSISGVGTDTVPALLTPGEFVVNKKSAQAFGYGNLKEVNKYAKGGVVQKFQFGGVVGGLGGGLGGGGLLSGIGDELLGIGSSFAALQVSTAAYNGILEGAVGPVKGLIEVMKEERENRKKNAESLERLDNLRIASIQTTQELTDAYEKAVGDLEVKKGQAQTEARKTAFAAAESSGSQQATFSAGDGKGAANAEKKLQKAIAIATNKYGKNSQELAEISQLQKKYSGNVVAQQAAVSKYTRELNKADDAVNAATREEQNNINSLKRKIDAEKKLTQKYIEEADDIKSQGGIKGFFGKIGGKKSIEGLAKAADLAANVGIAIFVNQLNKASDAAQKLSDKAIEAGNVEEAKAKASEAAAKRAQAAAQTQASAALSGVGSAIGSIFGPIGTLVGGVIGKLLSLIPGVTEAFATLTDWLGITNYEAERQAAAIKAANAALKNWEQKLEESGKKLIEEAKLRGESAEQISKILANQASQQSGKVGEGSVKERKERVVGLEGLVGIDAFRQQFREQAQTSGAGDVAGVLESSPNLKKTFDEFSKTLESEFEFEEVVKFREELNNAAKTAAVQRQKFDEVNNELQVLRLSAGQTVSALDVLGKSVSKEVADDLKRLEPLVDARIKSQQAAIDSELKRIDIAEDIAKRQAAFTGKEGSQDQLASRTERDRQRLSKLVGDGPDDPKSFDQVNAAVAASGEELLKFANKIKAAKERGDSAKELSKLSEEFKQAQQDSKNLRTAQDVLLNGIKFQEEAIRKEAKARLEAIAALDDFKGGLVEEFAFGTDEDRRDLGRSAAVTAQAIQQGGLQNIASEDRGRVKSFLDRLPQDVAIQQFKGKTAGRLKGEFAADEAIRSGLIGANQREEFIQKVEQQGKPIEERVGTAFEEGQRIINESFAREQQLTFQKLEAEKASQAKFAESVAAFEKAAQGPEKEKLDPKERQGLVDKLKQLEDKRAGLGDQQGDIDTVNKLAAKRDELLAKAKRVSQVDFGNNNLLNEARDRRVKEIKGEASVFDDQIKTVKKRINEERPELDKEIQALKARLENAAPAGPAGGGGIINDTFLKRNNLKPAAVPARGGLPAGVPAGGQAGTAGGQAGPAGGQAVVGGEITQNVTGLDGMAKALAALGNDFPIKQVLAEFFTKAANSNSPDDWKNAASDAANGLQNPPSDTVPPGGA